MTEVEIHTDTIQLDQFLKLAGAVPSGGMVKELIAAGAILRNGAVETANSWSAMSLQSRAKIHTVSFVRNYADYITCTAFLPQL